MDRRWGWILVMGALLAAVLTPNITGRHVTGIPRIGPIDGPPVVGDCLLGSPTPSGSVDPSGSAVYVSRSMAACAADRYGEVMAILPDGLSSKGVQVSDHDGMLSFDDPNADRCRSELTSYLAPETATALWSPAISFAVIPIRPDDLQLSVGQTWIACVVYVVTARGAVARYSGTLRDSAHTGLSSEVAVPFCLSSTDYFVQHAVDCVEPHPVEAFAMMRTGSAQVTQQSLDDRCRRLVLARSGISNPTALGLLVPKAVAFHHASDGTPAAGLSTDDENGFAMCEESGTPWELRGSLLGLGGGPIPWTP